MCEYTSNVMNQVRWAVDSIARSSILSLPMW